MKISLRLGTRRLVVYQDIAEYAMTSATRRDEFPRLEQ